MDGSATFATDRFRFATPATTISAVSTSPARAGADEGIEPRPLELSAVCDSVLMQVPESEPQLAQDRHPLRTMPLLGLRGAMDRNDEFRETRSQTRAGEGLGSGRPLRPGCSDEHRGRRLWWW